jgi:hypothetical protein
MAEFKQCLPGLSDHLKTGGGDGIRLPSLPSRFGQVSAVKERKQITKRCNYKAAVALQGRVRK